MPQVIEKLIPLDLNTDYSVFMDNGVDTIPYGHYSLKEHVFYRKIFEDTQIF